MKIVAFDTETTGLAPQGESVLEMKDPLHISCAATCVAEWKDDGVQIGEERSWFGNMQMGADAASDFMPKATVGSLADYLLAKAGEGFVVVGFNSLSFDLPVMARNGDAETYAKCQKIALAHVDMFYEMICRKGFGCSLAAMAEPLGLSKTEGFNGAMAVEAWNTGEKEKRFQVLRYCMDDARVTAKVALMCCKSGRVEWVTKDGSKRKVWGLRTNENPDDVSFRWSAVAECARLPLPNTSWMDGPPPDIRGRVKWAKEGAVDALPAAEGQATALDTVLPWDDAPEEPKKPSTPMEECIERERELRAQDKRDGHAAPSPSYDDLIEMCGHLADYALGPSDGKPAEYEALIIRKADGTYQIMSLRGLRAPEMCPLGDLVVGLKPVAAADALSEWTKFDKGILPFVGEALLRNGVGTEYKGTGGPAVRIDPPKQDQAPMAGLRPQDEL